MSVHKKLMEARIRLQNTKLSKSGHNKFAGYTYFELGDFLPAIQEIFSDIGLCGIINFYTEEGDTKSFAELRIFDTNPIVDEHNRPIDQTTIAFQCPMAQASLKGCHEVQNLGASMTYIRRYLWVNALEIVEHDALDATTGSERKGVIHKPTKNPDYQPEGEELEFITGVVDTILGLDTDYEAINNYLHTQLLDADQKTWVWDKLDSKTRSAIKKLNSKD